MGQKWVWPHWLLGNQVTEMRDCLAPAIHLFQSDASWPCKASVFRTRSLPTPSPPCLQRHDSTAGNTPSLWDSEAYRATFCPNKRNKAIWKSSPWKWVLGQLWLCPLPSCKTIKHKVRCLSICAHDYLSMMGHQKSSSVDSKVDSEHWLFRL